MASHSRCHSDESGDEVVYKEQNVYDDDVTIPVFSQTQASVAEPTPVLLPRHERRRRQQEMVEEGSTQSSGGSQEETIDPFSALESLLERPSVAQTSPVQETESTAAPPQQAAVNSSKAVMSQAHQFVAESQVHGRDETVAEPPCEREALSFPSQPQAAISTQSLLASQSQPTSWSQSRVSLPKAKSSLASKRSATAASLLDEQGPQNLLDHSRRFAAKRLKAVKDRAARAGTRPEKGAKKLAVTRSKSIVGSRPLHWASRATENLDPTCSLLRFSRQQKAHIAKEQAAISMPPPKPVPPKKVAGSVKPPSRIRSAQDNATLPSLNTSFVPAFLSTPASNPIPADDINANDDDDGFAEATVHSPTPAYQSPIPKSRKKSSQGGPLFKRLKLIRDAVKGDTIRFQSGQYPFTKTTSFDMNDPRNRATSYMDVTVVGSGAAWEDQQKLTFLGFVHAHVAQTTSAPLPGSCLAWLCFSYETVRERNLQPGSQLRIYNPVTVPFVEAKPPDRLAMPTVEWIVACTQLCESYPDCLPQLPDLDTVKGTLFGSNNSRKE